MSTFVEQNSKQSELNSQSSQAMPATDEYTIDKVKSWNTNKLLKWIQQNLSQPLNNEDKELFLKAKISGRVFLKGACNDAFFMRAGFSFGAGVELAELAKDIVNGKGKSCRLHQARKTGEDNTEE
jgi:hypothetical protein